MKRLCYLLLALVLLTGCGKKENAPVLPVTDSPEAYTAKFTPDPAPKQDDLIRDRCGDWTLRLDDAKEFLFLDTPDGTVWETKLRWTGNDRVYVLGDTVYLHLGRELYTVTADGSRQLDQKTRWIDTAPDGDRLLAIGMPPASETPSYQLCAITGTDIACLGTLDVEGFPKYLSKDFLFTTQAAYLMDEAGLTKLASLPSLGIDPNSITGLRTDENGICLVTAEGYYRLVPAGDEQPKVHVSMYCYNDWLGLFSGLVSRFNAQSDTIVVDLTAYDYNNLEALNTKLVTGNLPDLLCADEEVSLLRMAQHRGLLAPVTPLLDAVITEEDYFSNIAYLDRIDGEVYYFPLNFGLYTYRFPVELLDGRTKFESLEEMDQVQKASMTEEEYAAGLRNNQYSQEMILPKLVAEGMYHWVDYNSQTANFEDPMFGQVLEYAKRFLPMEEAMSQGRSETNPPYLFPFHMIGSTEQEPFSENYYEHYHTFPFPLSPYEGAGVESQCLISRTVNENNTEAVDTVLRWLLSSEAQSYLVQHGNSWTQIPLLRSAIVKNEKVCPGDRAYMMDLIEHADHYHVLDLEIYAIIEEEASYYFNDQKSLEDTQAMIQDRVSLYLAELK